MPVYNILIAKKLDRVFLLVTEPPGAILTTR